MDRWQLYSQISANCPLRMCWRWRAGGHQAGRLEPLTLQKWQWGLSTLHQMRCCVAGNQIFSCICHSNKYLRTFWTIDPDNIFSRRRWPPRRISTRWPRPPHLMWHQTTGRESVFHTAVLRAMKQQSAMRYPRAQAGTSTHQAKDEFRSLIWGSNSWQATHSHSHNIY